MLQVITIRVCIRVQVLLVAHLRLIIDQVDIVRLHLQPIASFVLLAEAKGLLTGPRRSH